MMLVRIGVALGALYCIHGGDNVAQEGAALAKAARENAPKAAIALCLDHAAQCTDLGSKLVGIEAANLAVGVMAVNMPQPPRKTVAIDANSDLHPIKKLDREGLKRAVQSRG
jgi:hypothetical protein